MITWSGRFAAALLMTVLLGLPVSAQTPQGAIVSGAVGVTAAESKTNLSFSASAGYRFNRGLAFTIELASVPSIDSDESRIDITRFDTRVVNIAGAGGIGFNQSADDSGSLTSFTANLRLEMPTTASRVLPYAIIGGGVANVKESFRIIYNIPPLASSLIPLPPVPIDPVSFTQSSTDMALTLGGGVSLLRGNHLSFDIDLRYLRLIGYEDRDIGRFGAGVSYRF